MLDNQIFTTKEAAKYLKVNPQVMERYLREGVVPARKLGRQWRISKLALDLWLSPSLAQALPRLTTWNKIFALGDIVGDEIKLSEEEILKLVKKSRSQRGLELNRRSGH